MSGFIRKAPVGSAVSELDFYGQPAVDTPHLAYRELLDAGPVVWLPRHKVLAVARFAPSAQCSKRTRTLLVHRA
ncbi:hypothetical protein N8077_04400 [Myxococcota bacterium]|nr:hypothetical protein [Myxococcota bacterium]